MGKVLLRICSLNEIPFIKWSIVKRKCDVCNFYGFLLFTQKEKTNKLPTCISPLLQLTDHHRMWGCYQKDKTESFMGARLGCSVLITRAAFQH